MSTWPERPTCHDGERRYGDEPIVWRAPRGSDGGPYSETFRTCSYCGSIHPEDLVAAVKGGASVHGSDWVYGWPHKFYIEGIPNPIAGQLVAVGSESKYDAAKGKRETTPIMGAAPTAIHAKWYNVHILDDGFDVEARNALLFDTLATSGVNFEIVNGELKYRAPYHGFQR